MVGRGYGLKERQGKAIDACQSVTRVYFWVGVPCGWAGHAGSGVGGSDLRWRMRIRLWGGLMGKGGRKMGIWIWIWEEEGKYVKMACLVRGPRCRSVPHRVHILVWVSEFISHIVSSQGPTQTHSILRALRSLVLSPPPPHAALSRP